MIILLVPVMVVVLVRLNRAYEAEDDELQRGRARRWREAPILRTHTVVVLVDELDVAAARAIQYARTLTPDELRAVHFDLDPWKTEQLAERGASSASAASRSTSSSAPTGACPRAALELATELDRRGDTEVTVLIPAASTPGSGTACCTTARPNSIAAALGDMPHCNVTIVPYHLGRGQAGDDAAPRIRRRPPSSGPSPDRRPPTSSTAELPAGRTRIANLDTRSG